MEYYTYMDESLIDDQLKCDICHKPLINPVSLPDPCEDIFCRQCIQSNLNNHSNNCLKCNKKNLSNQDLKNEGRAINKILDKIPVKCSLCNKKNIKRIDILGHIQQSCPKRIVSCRAHDIHCQWTGPYDKLNQHIDSCPYENLRSFITELLKSKQDLNQIKNDYQNLNDQYNQQLNEINKLTNENQILNEQINPMKNLEVEHKTLQEQFDQQLNEINKLTNENQILNEQINPMKNLEDEHKTLKEQSDQQLNEINKLKNEYKLIQEQYDQNEIDTNNLKIALTNLNESSQENLNKLNISQEDNQTLQQHIQEQQLKINSLDQENQDLKQELYNFEQIQIDNSTLYQHYQQQQIEIDSLYQQNQDLKHQLNHIEHLQIENQQLNEQSIQNNLQIEQLTINIKQFEAKSSNKMTPFNKLLNNNDYENSKLKELIEKCQTTSLVNLNGEKLNDNDINIVINIGLINKQCESLILWNNCLTSNSIIKFSSFLKINQTLKKLSISKNSLSDESIKYLSESLSYDNSTLKDLILSSNKITDQGLIYLSNMLKSNKTITVFGLHDNQISDKSIQYFTKVIQFYNKVIEEISLYSNKLITDLSIDFINNMIINNKSLKILWIWDCQFSKQEKTKLQQSIQSKIEFDLRL